MDLVLTIGIGRFQVIFITSTEFLKLCKQTLQSGLEETSKTNVPTSSDGQATDENANET